MSRGRKRIVTPEKLRDAAARGISQGALARELGVTKAAISAAVQKFCIQVGFEHREATIFTAERMRLAVERGLTPAETALFCGGSVGGVKHAEGRYGVTLVSGHKRRPRGINKTWRPWTTEETTTLRRLWLAGVPTVDIAKALPGRTDDMVIGKAHRMKLPRHPALSWPRAA